jgi:sugar transferase EpsL
MGAPVLFTQIRSGQSKKGFTIYKFRTMRDGAEGDSDEDRITSLGNTLRRWSLDELPQLFNVVKGDMSLVGPRPLLPEYDAYYSDEQNKRFLVKPGVTGLAQVVGRNDLQWNEKFALDIAYVNSLSALNDL